MIPSVARSVSDRHRLEPEALADPISGNLLTSRVVAGLRCGRSPDRATLHDRKVSPRAPTTDTLRALETCGRAQCEVRRPSHNKSLCCGRSPHVVAGLRPSHRR